MYKTVTMAPFLKSNRLNEIREKWYRYFLESFLETFRHCLLYMMYLASTQLVNNCNKKTAVHPHSLALACRESKNILRKSVKAIDMFIVTPLMMNLSFC